jgi:hypothetical protein
MRRHLRLCAPLLALACLADCNKAIEATANGVTVASWKLPDLRGDQTAEHDRALDLADGVKLRLVFAAGAIDHEGTRLQLPLTASVIAVDAAGLQLAAAFSPTPLHHEGELPDDRSLDVRVTATRDVAGCLGDGFESRTTILRLHPDGVVSEVAPAADP